MVTQHNKVPTRWYSACSAIKFTLTIRSALESVPHDEQFSYSNLVDAISDSGFCHNLEAAEEVFARLSKLVAFAESKDARLSQVFENLLQFVSYVLDSDTIDYRIRVATLRSYLCYFHRMDIDLVLAAYILYPNQRYKNLTSGAVHRAKVRPGTYLFEMDHDDVAGRHLKHDLVSFEGSLKSLNEPKPDIQKWLRDSKFSVLKILGPRFCSFTPSSANTERVFSALGLMISSRRHRLDISTVLDATTFKIHVVSRSSAPQARQRDLELSYEIIDEPDDIEQADAEVPMCIEEQEVVVDDPDIDSDPELEQDLAGILERDDTSELESQETYLVEEGNDVYASRAYRDFISLIQFGNDYLDSVEDSSESFSQSSDSSVSRSFASFS